MPVRATLADDDALSQGRKPVARAGRAMVATSHPFVTAVAIDVLRAGGNAVDAMLTAVPLQQVLEPQLSTIAGGFGMLYWDSASGTATYLNANPDHPSGATLLGADSPETSGHRIAVPSTVPGMHAAAERFGTRPWGSYFAPAISAAEDGFAMYAHLYAALATARARITHHPSGRERYLPDGYIPPVGQTVRQPRLAATLRRVSQSDGVEWFTSGAFAESFVAAVGDTGGTMTTDDMAGYEPRWADPLRFTFAGHEILGTALPDTGGLYCAFALGVLERTRLDQLGSWPISPRALALIARAQAVAAAHVGRYGADPLAFDIPVKHLLSPEYLNLTARLLEGSWRHVATTPATDQGTGRGAPPKVPPDAAAMVGSNQVIIADEAGNWVSMLHTGYGTDFGTGLVVEGVGVNSANLFPGNTLGAGRRIVAPLSSTLVLKDGRPWLGLGSTGQPPPYVTLVLLNLLKYGMGLPEAIEAPRFALDNDGPLAVENRIAQTTLDGLADLGFPTRSLGGYGPTGMLPAVMRDHDDDQFSGVVDPRSSGQAAGYS